MKYSNEEMGPVIIAIVVNCITGLVNVLVKKTLDGGIDHMIVASYRLAISTLFLAPIAYFWERGSRPKLTASILGQLFFSALLGASLTQYFILLGLHYTSATVACAFLSMVPALTFILALLFRIEKVNLKSNAWRAKVIGTFVCISGALFLSFYKGVAVTPNNKYWQTKLMSNQPTNNGGVHNKKENWVLGILFLLAGSSFWSAWLLVQAKINKRYPCHYSSTAILSFFGTIQSALLSLINQRNLVAWVLTDKFDILTIVFAGVFGQGISTVALTWCIKKKGALFTSAFTPLMLIFASLFDFTILHHPIYLGSVLGSIVIIIGLYIFLWGKSKDPNEIALKQTQLTETNQDLTSTTSQVLPITMSSTISK